MEQFSRFSEGTGLKANPSKCKVYFGGVLLVDQSDILEATGFCQGALPFKYLGVPLSSRKLSVHLCKPLIDKILARVQHWTARLLSYAGKLQLIKSVVFSITSYWMQIFPLPKKVLRHIESLCRIFL